MIITKQGVRTNSALLIIYLEKIKLPFEEKEKIAYLNAENLFGI